MKLGLMYFVEIFFVLAIIIIIFYAGNYLLNFIPGKKFRNQRIKVLDYLGLQAQMGIYLLAIDNEEYVVTVGNRTIVHIVKKEKISFSEELKKKTEKDVVSSSN